ncbi:alpha/beta hydrolase family protein [Wolffia australiana]
MPTIVGGGDVRAVLHTAAAAFSFNSISPCREIHHLDRRRQPAKSLVSFPFRSYPRCSQIPPPSAVPASARLSPMSEVESVKNAVEKPPVCTADELHYVAVPGTEWRIALWRYVPCADAPSRNHPLMLLSGVGTNAIGYDLSPTASFARSMATRGFDTWIVEVRGAGLSTRIDQEGSNEEGKTSFKPYNTTVSSRINGHRSAIPEEQNLAIQPNEGNDDVLSSWEESQLVTKLTETFTRLTERVSGYISESQLREISDKFFDQMSKLLEDAQLSQRFEDVHVKISRLLEAGQNSALSSQIGELSRGLVSILEESHRSVSPPLFDLHERLSTTIEDFQKQLDLVEMYNWDFDNYLEEDIPAAMEYIKQQTRPKDGKLLAIGHSMGGILLYAMISRHGFERKKSQFAAVVTLASSLDYTSSRSSLKLLVPLADPAQVLNVPVIPIGALLAAAYPLTSRPPYVLSWLNSQISSQGMMHPELFEKLVLKNFCTVPAKLLLQLTTAFKEGGLLDRKGNFRYKNHMRKCTTPVLALAGDEDLICPPEAVYETVKAIPSEMVTYRVFGRPEGPHYAHYDLVGGRLAMIEVYPCVVDFLVTHDAVGS